MASQHSLSDLSVDLLFAIFKQLDRPSKISLALSSPKMLHLFAKYYDLDRYRNEPLFVEKLGVPESLSWDDSKAQGAIIRWMALPGNDDIDDPGDDMEDEQLITDDDLDFNGNLTHPDDERFKPYEETKAGKEELVVQGIIGGWLEANCGVEGGVVFCAECYRFMRLHLDSRGRKPWCTKMLTRGLWFRHCGTCEDRYDIARDAVLT